jgi:hypothetical protein
MRSLGHSFLTSVSGRYRNFFKYSGLRQIFPVPYASSIKNMTQEISQVFRRELVKDSVILWEYVF